MFKKKPTIKPLAPLRSSDRRKLADQIIQDYNLQPAPQTTPTPTTPDEIKAAATSAHTALRASILPESTQSARFTTTQGPELKQATGTLYIGSFPPSSESSSSPAHSEPRILWFQHEDRLYPTVYTLWHNPNLIPLLHTPGPVVAKLQGGADLMTPGLARGPPFPATAVEGAVVAVASLEAPSVPMVLGVCEIDVAALGSVRGEKGHAIRCLHWVGDEAWAFGATGRAGQVPPEELAWGLAEEMEGLTVGGVEAEEDGEAAGGVRLDDGEDLLVEERNGHRSEEQGLDAEVVESSQAVELTQKEIDDAFRNAFLYGVVQHKENNGGQSNFGLDFPLSPSFIMSTLINPFLPAFTPEQEKQLQIKKTSWKTLKKFIKYLDKQQIVKSKDMNGNETVIMDIDFDDAAVLGFKPYRLPKKETLAGTSQGRGAEATSQTDSSDDSIGQKLQITTFLRPTARLSALLDTTSQQFFTTAEVRQLITTYIENNNLISSTNKRLVNLDPILADSIFDSNTSALDREILSKGAVPRDALLDRVVKAMNSSYAIQRTVPTSSTATNPKPKSGSPPKISITLETRSGNKTVTKVAGLEPFYVSPRLLADELRKVCAGSTAVEPLAGAAKKNEKPVEVVMVQGPQRDAVVKALERRGVLRQWVEVLDKTKKKK